MNKVKISVPVGNQKTKQVEGYREVSGIALGPFLIHRSVSPVEGWTVTHVRTGFVIHQGIPRQGRAFWLAGELNGYDVWEFSTPADALLLPAHVRQKITEARHAVMRDLPPPITLVQDLTA